MKSACPKIRLTKLDRLVVEASRRGYRVNGKGQVVSPTGNLRPCRVRATSESGYKHCAVNVRFGSEVVPIPTAKLLVFQKYGCRAFARGIVTRHLNNDSLDNRPANVKIGTRSQNALDMPKAKRVKLAKKAARASAKARRK